MVIQRCSILRHSSEDACLQWLNKEYPVRRDIRFEQEAYQHDGYIHRRQHSTCFERHQGYYSLTVAVIINNSRNAVQACPCKCMVLRHPVRASIILPILYIVGSLLCSIISSMTLSIEPGEELLPSCSTLPLHHTHFLRTHTTSTIPYRQL